MVFAPGYDSDPEAYTTLLESWAAAGFLVAAPDFPGSADDLPGAPVETDITEQALDVSFVVSSLLTGSEGPVDPGRIAVAGHSDGGDTVAVLALDPGYRDPRIRAYVSLAGQLPAGVDDPFGSSTATGDFLVMVGSDDQYGEAPLSRTVFDLATMPKALVVITGGDHLGPFEGSSPLGDAVRAAIVRFLDLTLGGPVPVDGDRMTSVLDPPVGSDFWTVTTG